MGNCHGTLFNYLYLSFYFISIGTPSSGPHTVFTQIPISDFFFLSLYYLTLIPLDPYLSDDLYRYLWEGKVQHYGFNPYALVPDSPLLEQYRDSMYAKMNYHSNAAIYPPLAQFLFFLSTKISYTVLFFKIMLFGFFLGSSFLLVKLLEMLQYNKLYVLYFSLNPLIIIETAVSGHFEIVGVFFLLLAIYLLQKEYFLGVGISLACATMVKFLPVVLLPFFIQKIPRNKRIYLALFFITCVLFYLPFIDAKEKLFVSLLVYSKHWYFNSLFYTLFMDVLHNRILYVLCCFAIIGGAFYFQYFSNKNIYHASFVVIGLALLLSPVVYPWYLVWIIALFPFIRSLPFNVFTYLVQFSYCVLPLYLTKGIWKESMVVIWLEFGLFVVFALVYYRDCFVRWKERFILKK